VGVETVRENASKYTKREVQRAKLARKYVKRMGNIAPAQLIKLLKQGKIKNAEIDEHDVVRTLDIEGKDLGNLKGKTVRSHVQSFDSQVTRAKALVKEDQIMHIDLMFYNGCGYLLCIFTPLEYICVRKVKSRTTKELFEHIKRCVDHIKRSKLRVTVIRCDEESGIESENMENLLNDYDSDIELDVAAGSESVGVAERKIRTVKERIRGYLNTLPYLTDEVLEEWLCKYVVHYLNWTPTTNAMDGRSPLERLSGRTIDASTDLKFEFGEYVQLGDGETSNSMEERTRGALALMPAGNRDGSWYFLVLKSWRKVRRNKAVALPMPDEVIEYIDTKARMSSRKRRIGETAKIGLWRADGKSNYYQDIDNDEGEQENEDDEAKEEAVVAELQQNYVEPNTEDYITIEEQYDDEDDDEDVDNNQNDNEDRVQVMNDIFGPDSDDEFEAAWDESVKDNESSVEHEVQDEKQGGQEVIQATIEEVSLNDEENKDAGLSYNLRGNRAQPGRWKGLAMTTRQKVKHNRMIKKFMKRKFSLNMTVRQAIRKLGYQAILSIVQEIVQLNDMNTFEGVNTNELTSEELRRIISSSMFLKDKYTADGVFEKLKARLVAGGHLQDREVYDNGVSQYNVIWYILPRISANSYI